MTLLVVLMLGLGAVLIVSAFETDPGTGHSVPVLQTIADVWNNTVDFSQPGKSDQPPVPNRPAPTPTPAPTPGPAPTVPTYENAATLDYLRNRQV